MEQILDTKKASAMPFVTPNNPPVDNNPVGYDCITNAANNQAGNGEGLPKKEIHLTADEREIKAVQFLTKYFSGCHGYSYLWLKDKATDKSLTLAFDVQSEKEIAAQVKHAFKLNDAEFWDLYFSVNVGSKRCSEKNRHKVDDISAQISVVTDIDIRNTTHHKGDAEKYPPTLDAAISYLPVKPTILISSGGGIHAYYKLDTPLIMSNADEREKATNRGKCFLDVIRANAGAYSKSVDGVQDLPRILRLPYSLNCKNRDNRKMCYVLEESEQLFTTAQIDEIIASNAAPVKSDSAAGTTAEKDAGQSLQFNSADVTGINCSSDDNPPEYEIARAIGMLNCINPADLQDNEWLAVNSACKNLGLAETFLDNWNKRDAERYNERENKTRYDSLNDPSFDMETLHGIAKKFGYVERDFKRQWYKDNPQFDNRLKRVQEYSRKAGREFVPLDFFATVEQQIIDAEKIAENYIAAIDDFSNDNIFSWEVLSNAAILKRSKRDGGTYENFYQACKDAKINLTRFNERVKTYSATIQNFIFKVKGMKRQARADYAAVKNYSADDNFVYPEGYEVSTEKGIIRLGTGEIISYAPIRISAVYCRDNDKTFLVDIWTLLDGKPFTIAKVDKGVIADARKLITLSSQGLDVNSGTAADLVKYLAAFINANEEILKPQKLLQKLGWYNDETKFFITPFDKRYKIDMDALGDYGKSFVQRGNFEVWKQTARELIKYPVAAFCLSAALATPLLRIFSERSFSTYVLCESRAGKSAVLRFCVSCWGNQEFMKTLRATRNGIEGELAESSDFPFICDERQSADKNFDMAALCYLIGEGVGKARMSKDAKGKPRYRWLTQGIMAGEEPLLEDARTQGAQTRTLTLEVQGNKLIPDELSRKIHTEIINHHYGYAGQFFIDNLLQENFSELCNLREKIIATLRQSDKKLIDDHYRYIATNDVALFLLQKYFFGTSEDTALNTAIDNAGDIVALLKTEKQLSDVNLEWELVSGWITSHRGEILNNPNMEISLDSNGNARIPNPQKIIGKYDDGELFVISSKLRDELRRLGYSHSKVIRDLTREGYIVPFADGQTTQVKWIENAVGRARVFRFNFNPSKV